MTDRGRARADLPVSDSSLLPQRIFWFRALGMALAGIFMARVLWENQSGWIAWSLLVFTCLLWAPLALVHRRRSRDPYRAELGNLMFDSALAGLWVGLLEFNLLPSALLLTLAVVDKINSGIRNLWLRSLPGIVIGIVVGALLSGFSVQLESSMAVIIACIPMLVIHTTAVALNGYMLVRKVQRQNLQLDELSRIDVLTGLAGRRDWQEQASRALQRAREDHSDACLMLIDVDEFKRINDEGGHTFGDDVLCRIADILESNFGDTEIVGRIGGDEFAVVIPADLSSATRQGQIICDAVAALQVEQWPSLRCSVSCGVASAEANIMSLRDWMIAADTALYRAKNAGRNQVQIHRSAAVESMEQLIGS